MPKLSIITINYNNVEGLKSTIASVLSQTSTDFEYLVIDGGSTDGSKELIEKNKDLITYWVSEPDDGIYNAMNKGVLAAQGEYCQFLNSGDYLCEENVTFEMLKLTDDFSFLAGNMYKNWNGKVQVIDKMIFEKTMLHFYIGSINHSSIYIKKNLFEKYGLYDEKLKIVSDWKFFLQVIALGDESIKFVDIDVSVFDMSGISNSNPNLDKLERRKVLEELIPKAILKDYDDNWRDIVMIQTIKRYRVIYFFVWAIARIIVRFRKFLNKIHYV